MTAPLSLRINGEDHNVGIAPEVPLLSVLRDTLGKTGARFGCGDGLCGACTVLIDGKVALACDTPVGAAMGKIETIEGIASGTEPHPVVVAMLEQQAGQCGYCLPGIVMAAVALLREVPRPSRAQIAAALDTNLCRCGAHLRILSAIEIAAARIVEDRS